MTELQAPDSAFQGLAGGDLDDELEALRGSMDGLGAPAEFELRTSAADVDDSFYQFATPQLSSWFAINQMVNPRDYGVSMMWCSRQNKFRKVADGERCFLGFACLPMGWSWALHFCHSAVSHLARLRQGIQASDTVQERTPAPSLLPSQPALGSYVDNVYSIGCAIGDSLKMVASFVAESDSRGLRLHWEHQDDVDATVLGVSVCGRSRLIRPTSRRLWRLD